MKIIIRVCVNFMRELVNEINEVFVNTKIIISLPSPRADKDALNNKAQMLNLLIKDLSAENCEDSFDGLMPRVLEVPIITTCGIERILLFCLLLTSVNSFVSSLHSCCFKLYSSSSLFKRSSGYNYFSFFNKRITSERK
jgi:hypothetical protein